MSPLSPIRHAGFNATFTLPLAPIPIDALIRGNSVSAVSSSALRPPQPVYSHALEAITSPPLVWHSGTSIDSLCSCSQGSFARRGYSVHLHHRSYNPIRQSDRLLPTSDFNPYTGGLCHSRIVPDYLSDLPQFNLRFLLYMPPSLPQRAVLLHSSVASQDVSVFAQNAEARHPLHYSRHLPPVARRVD